MSERVDVLDLAPTDVEHVAARGDALARLALVQAPDLTVFENRGSRKCDLVVVTGDGIYVRITVQAYSSRMAGIERVDEVPELRWPVAADDVRRARASQGPAFLFLFDADTRHGRYARLDVLPEPARGTTRVMVSLPLSNRIDPASLNGLVAGLRTARRELAGSGAA